MYFGCSTAGNRKTTVSKTRSILHLRTRIAAPFGPVLVLGEGLCEPPGHEGQVGMPAHVRMSRAARRMCVAGIVGYTQSSSSEAASGAADWGVGPVAPRN